MATPLIPQEIFLLERYGSADYFGEMRDAWARMVGVAEDALDVFVHRLPADYRRRPLPEQPDIVWGERVLPNFRSVLASLNSSFIQLSKGDLGALDASHAVQSAIKGQTADYPPSWMPEESQTEFWSEQAQAGQRAFNIAITERADWKVGSLSLGYRADIRGDLDAPAEWPLYRVRPDVTVRSGDAVVQSGIYLPTCDDSCAELLIKDYEASDATIGLDPATGQRLRLSPTNWMFVERVGSGGGGLAAGVDQPVIRLRCAAGHACPRSGYWFTPARIASRRPFQSGDVMPDLGGPYGATIWQWDEQQ